MAINLEEFENIKTIIEENNSKVLTDVNSLKEQLREILKDISLKIKRIYPTIIEINFYSIDDYEFNSSYENSSAIRFFFAVKVNNDNVNFNFLKKPTKKRLSARKKLLQKIILEQQKDVPYIEDLTNDIYRELLKYISSEDRVFQKNGVTRIILNNGYIIDVISSYQFVENEITYLKNTKWLTINPLKMLENYKIKERETQNNFSTMIKLFKSLEKEIIYAEISNIYISKIENLAETLLYNVPNEFFLLDIKNSFLKIVNYLINTDFSNFVSIDNTQKMFNKKSIYTIAEAKNYSRKVLYAYNNFEKIIKITSVNNQNINKNIVEEKEISKPKTLKL